VLTQPLFFLVLPGLVRDPLIRALWVPVRLPHLVWISSGCGSAVVRRSSRSLRGFGVSLPVAWSHPTLAGIKLVIHYSTASYLCVHQPTVVKIGPTLYRYPIGTYHVVIRAIVVTVGFIIIHLYIHPSFTFATVFIHHIYIYIFVICSCPIVH
jgi:hypothetical protein